jgi:glutaminyl-peptide cyclotransferase
VEGADQSMRLQWTGLLGLFLSLTRVSPYKPLSDDQAALLRTSIPLPLSSYLSPKSGSILSPILVPRPSGSQGANQVLEHFRQFFASNVSNWKIFLDDFTDSTPRGNVKFTNFVATRDPPGVRTGDVGRLVVAAHYDSKWGKKGSALDGFIGATDSAVPCAMLMYAALALETHLAAREQRLRTEDDLEDPIGLQVTS